MELLPCPVCSTLLAPSAAACPTCSALRGSPATPNRLAAALLLGLAVLPDSGCLTQSLYGIALVDADEDGYVEGEDCDDSDPDVNPDAEETPGDEVDSNCDGADDT